MNKCVFIAKQALSCQWVTLMDLGSRWTSMWIHCCAPLSKLNCIKSKVHLLILFHTTKSLWRKVHFTYLQFRLYVIVNRTPSGCIAFLTSNQVLCSNYFFANIVAGSSMRTSKAFQVCAIHTVSDPRPKWALSKKHLSCGQWFIIGKSSAGTWWGRNTLPAIPSTRHEQKPPHHHQNMTWCHIPKFTLF